MKKISILLATLLLTTSLNAMEGKGIDKTWNEFMQELQVSQMTDVEKELKKEQDTKDYIFNKHGVFTNRADITKEIEINSRKNIDIALMYRMPQDYSISQTYTGTDETGTANTITVVDKESTSSLGISLTGLLNFGIIGLYTEDLYSSIDVYDDKIGMFLFKRIQSKDARGFYVEAGTGFTYQTKETSYKKDRKDFLIATTIGYNFKTVSVKLNYSYSLFDAYYSKDYKYSLGDTLQIGIGYRF